MSQGELAVVESGMSRGGGLSASGGVSVERDEMSRQRRHEVLTVEEMFGLADANSLQLKPLLTSVKEAEEGIRVAKSARLPELNASLSFSFLGDGFVTDRDFSDYSKAEIPHFGNNFALEASQVVYAGGAVNAGIRLAELEREMAVYRADEKRDAVRFMVMGYYLDIFKCRNLRSVLCQNISQTEGVIAEMRAKESEGVVLRNDITRYELLLSNLGLRLTQIDNTLEILNRNLAAALGLDEGVMILPDSTILDRSLPGMSRSEWIESAQGNSAVLKMARTGVSLSERGEDLVKAERLPHVALFAGYKLDGPITIEVPPIDKNFSYWYVGVGVNYSLSSLFKSNKKLSRSKAATLRAREEYAAAEEQVELAVNADYTRYLEAYEELRTQQKSVELALQNYDVTVNRYRNEMALITDMLDASNAKLEAEQQLVNAQINIIYYYYKLLYISGRL